MAAARLEPYPWAQATITSCWCPLISGSRSELAGSRCWRSQSHPCRGPSKALRGSGCDVGVVVPRLEVELCWARVIGNGKSRTRTTSAVLRHLAPKGTCP